MNGPMMSSLISSSITELEKFIKTSNEDINLKNKDCTNNVEELLGVKTTLNNVEKQYDSKILKLDELDEILKRFEKDGIPRMGDVNRRNKSEANLKSLNKECKETKKEITSSIGIQTDVCKKRIKDFEDDLKIFELDLKKRPFYYWKTGKDESFKSLDEANKTILE